VQERLRDYFRRRGDVRLALLFGSLARGQGRPESDLDVAVRFAPGSRRPGLEHPRFAVAADLSPLVGRSVDVVDLDEAPPGLAWAVAAEGIVLREAEPGLATDFRAAAYDRYCDTAPLRRLREAYVLDALRGTPR
jgi:predicted nucleotidyltransferase